MLGLKYEYYQYFSYQDLQQLKEILTYDSIGEVKFYEDEKVIEYKINKSNCILLSELIELIRMGFIRFHLGQVLQLFIHLLEKVTFMRRKKFQHSYLDQDRIWLKFEHNQYLTITYKKIQYEIVFTGYKNKFNEYLVEQECDDSKKIQQIITNIIIDFIQNKIVCNKKGSSQDVIINKIYKVILESCERQDIQNTIDTINRLLKNNEFDSNYQTISFDDKIIDNYQYSKRKYKQEKIKDTLQNLISNYDKYPFVLNQLLFEVIKELRKNLKFWLDLGLDKNQVEHQYQTLLQTYERKYQEIYNDSCIKITNVINDSLRQTFEPIIKLKVDNYLTQTIIDQIMSLKILKYFENSRTIEKKYTIEFYDKLLYQNAISIIQDNINQYIRLQILILINDLI